ncbi:unannotated protein [freshwater metagenome]|uniref:Unannotated protein n=1 Tax=freshwater metagenome TaxID=449393 RepID=A0A6J7G855_9ZZZZ
MEMINRLPRSTTGVEANVVPIRRMGGVKQDLDLVYEHPKVGLLVS